MLGREQKEGDSHHEGGGEWWCAHGDCPWRFNLGGEELKLINKEKQRCWNKKLILV